MSIKIPNKGNVVLKFGSSWCGPCKQIKPILEELKKENESVDFIDIDVDKHPELTGKYAVRGIPKMVFIREGKVQSELVGVQSKEIIQQHIDIFDIFIDPSLYKQAAVALPRTLPVDAVSTMRRVRPSRFSRRLAYDAKIC